MMKKGRRTSPPGDDVGYREPYVSIFGLIVYFGLRMDKTALHYIFILNINSNR